MDAHDQPDERLSIANRALDDLDVVDDMRAELLPVAHLLAAPGPLVVTPQQRQRLITHLAASIPVAPTTSPVRQTLAMRSAQHSGRAEGMVALLRLAWTQAPMLRSAFWLVSAGIWAAGALMLLSGLPLSQTLVLQAIGPLLAYTGVAIAFRGVDRRALELELACPPSFLQLALARLAVTLCYDVLLGLLASALLSASDHGELLTLIGDWLMPLLLVTGLGLFLSLRLRFLPAVSLAYGAWLAFLALDTLSPLQAFPLTPLSDTLVGSLGLALLALALLRLHPEMHRLLPHAA